MLEANAPKTGFAGLVGKSMSKNVTFCGETVTIRKLNVRQVKIVQALAKDLEEDSEDGGFEILRQIISMAVEGADTVSAEDFEEFPMEELSKLSNEIMRFSGIGADQGK
jgi:hypothetical protein